MHDNNGPLYSIQLSLKSRFHIKRQAIPVVIVLFDEMTK